MSNEVPPPDGPETRPETLQNREREPAWTIAKLLAWSAEYFRARGIDSPRAAAEILLAHALKLRRIDLYLQFDKPLNADELAAFKTLVKRRVKREPVAYIVGEKGFWNLDFKVSEDVLIPRPETERLVEAALDVLAQTARTGDRSGPQRVLELGTGSGAVVLAVASNMPENVYFASDISIRALKTARSNASIHRPADTIHFFAGNWFTPLSPLGSPFDMILSNPPYVPSGRIRELQPEIHRFEPSYALDGGRNGLESLGHIILNAHVYLRQGGYLLLEIGYDQKAGVRRIIEQHGGYGSVAFCRDFGGRDRVVRMQKRT